MSENLTVTFKLPTRPPHPRSAPVGGQMQAEDAAAGTPTTPATPHVSRTARMIALAYAIERLIERKELKDYATAARVLGCTRARIAQVTALINLAAPLQERILTGELHVAERQLRRVLRTPFWDEQLAVVDAMSITRRTRTDLPPESTNP